MKAASIFGGVQLFSIIISIIRSKFIAVLLGPAGMGIAGLLNSTIGLVVGLTNFGLGTSAIREVASANSTGSETRIATVVTVLRRLVWVTGTLGMLVMLISSRWLSQFTFGNHDYTFAFICISITVLFTQLSTGQLVILRGMRRLQYLAKASLAGSALGLIVTVPIYYRFGIDGIVPSIIITSITSLTLSWYYATKIQIVPAKVSRDMLLTEGKDMLTMGFTIGMTGLLTMGTSYLLCIFIRTIGGVSQVGLYLAGFAIVNSYVGLVFNAMGTDYYPRLSEIAHDNDKCNDAINHQAEITLLILTPVILIFLLFIRWIVILLYSTKFIAVDEMIHWAALGLLFRAASWSISYVFLAKGDAKLFFWIELIASGYTLIANILGYYFYGLAGLGISFIVGYVLYLFHVFLISRIRYNFTFHYSFISIFFIQLLLTITCFILVKYFHYTSYYYFCGSIMILFSILYSFYELDKRIDLKSIIVSITK